MQSDCSEVSSTASEPVGHSIPKPTQTSPSSREAELSQPALTRHKGTGRGELSAGTRGGLEPQLLPKARDRWQSATQNTETNNPSAALNTPCHEREKKKKKKKPFSTLKWVQSYLSLAAADTQLRDISKQLALVAWQPWGAQPSCSGWQRVHPTPRGISSPVLAAAAPEPFALQTASPEPLLAAGAGPEQAGGYPWTAKQGQLAAAGRETHRAPVQQAGPPGAGARAERGRPHQLPPAAG